VGPADAMAPYQVQLAALESVALAVVGRQVSRETLVAAVKDGCGRAWDFARRHNLKAGRNVAVYWDGGIRLDAGIELPTTFAEAEGIVRSATPPGLTAFVAHVGPYERLGAAHAAIREWCSTHGHRLAGPNWEIYGHWQSEWNTDPSRIRTDVFYQVGSRNGE
jgi:effector-binding domain-containing protein